ncbi:Os02g0227300 [Oryza sativa Japonica Group]|uniref:Os02g0227300 protein n=1 Tax=Oryza sativa subsp. japonica TaxID=39947 RepID=A0A0P0VGN0_ORYSJ|nr:Os02g0227300 [Oryza sativa Japonica Group]
MRPKKVVSMCLSTAKAIQDSCVSESLAVVAAVMKSFSYVTINNWQDIGMPKNGTKLRARTFGANTTLPAFGHENIREST